MCCVWLCGSCFFFLKQKTAYELRISDWSSDVCSSDLGEDKPSQALRNGRGSSMGLAIDAVKRGDAGGAVSAGNTGALMAMAKLALRTMPGIDRPALAALLPTLGDNDFVRLDHGANTECDATNLVDRKSTRLNSSHSGAPTIPLSARKRKSNTIN